MLRRRRRTQDRDPGLGAVERLRQEFQSDDRQDDPGGDVQREAQRPWSDGNKFGEATSEKVRSAR